MTNNYGLNMNFNTYQKAAEKFAIYPLDHQIIYPTLGLVGEAGEVAEKIKKVLRDDNNLERKAVAMELGDVLWYIAALCRDLNIDMAECAEMNLDKLNDRKERGKLRGNGDNR